MTEHWSILAAREYGDESLAGEIRAEVDEIFADDPDDGEGE